MAEIPNNVFLAGKFARRFDGFSLGSNDLTQLVLGVDRDSEELASPFDEPGFAEVLVQQGIDSISLNPDSVIGVTRRVAAVEAVGLNQRVGAPH